MIKKYFPSSRLISGSTDYTPLPVDDDDPEDPARFPNRPNLNEAGLLARGSAAPQPNGSVKTARWSDDEPNPGNMNDFPLSERKTLNSNPSGVRRRRSVEGDNLPVDNQRTKHYSDLVLSPTEPGGSAD